MKKLFKKIIKISRKSKLENAIFNFEYYCKKLGYSVPSILFNMYKAHLKQDSNLNLFCILYNKEQDAILNFFSEQKVDVESLVKHVKGQFKDFEIKEIKE